MTTSKNTAEIEIVEKSSRVVVDAGGRVGQPAATAAARRRELEGHTRAYLNLHGYAPPGTYDASARARSGWCA